MDLRSRLVQIAIAFLLAALCVAARLAALQLAQHGFWEKEAVKARTRAVVIPFRRGSILDVHGRPLAATRTTFDVDLVLGPFRKGSTCGQLLLAHYLLTGERLPVGRVLADPAPFADEIAGLTVGEMRRLEPGARREDLLWYGAWLAGEEKAKPLIERLRRESEDALCFPSLELVVESGEITTRVEAEAATIAALERALALPPGEIGRRIDECFAATDARVKKLLARRGRADKRYESERDLHKDLDYRTTTLFRNVPHPIALELAASESSIPGLVASERTRRVYPPDFDACPLLVGRVGPPTREELDAYDALRDERDELSLEAFPTIEQSRRIEELSEFLRTDGLATEDELGREGLESSFEPLLRGRRGYKRTVNDRAGRESEVVDVVSPQAGLDVTLTLDVELQQAAERALARGVSEVHGQSGPRSVKYGAFVLLELPEMKVRVLASYPSPTREQIAVDWNNLVADESARPLHPRAWRPWSPPPPGSSVKPLLAAFALTAGFVTPATRYECTGTQLYAPREKRPVKCEGVHGEVGVHEALVKSCNHYFAQLAADAGSERTVSWLRLFGLGRRTGFADSRLADGTVVEGLAVEPSGIAESEPGGRNLMLLGLGQGKVDATPLQMAAAIGALAQRCYLPPTIVERVGGETPVRAEAVPLPIDAAAWRTVVAAMREVTQPGGTAGPEKHPVDLTAFDLATKTGTPQQGKPDDLDHSWFVGFFPSCAPRYAFAIFLERTGRHGGDASAPLLEDLFHDPAFAPIADCARIEAPAREGGP